MWNTYVFVRNPDLIVFVTPQGFQIYNITADFLIHRAIEIEKDEF